MLHSIVDFEESTEFERLVLERLCPVYSNSASDEIDLRPSILGIGGTQINVNMVESISAAALESQKMEMMPLLFGAAWKVLDLVVELSLNRAGLTPDQKNKWSIAKKVEEAKKAGGDSSILCLDNAVWSSMCAVYAATFEHRHCLVHRLAEFSGSPPRLFGSDMQGVPLRALETEELAAFISAAQIVASAVIGGGLDKRGEAHLRYELDRIRTHTGHASLGGLKANKPTIVRMVLTLSEAMHFEADFGVACEVANRVMPSAQFDLLIDVPDGSSRVVYAKLENVPRQKVRVDLDNLPSYLSFR